VDNGTTHRLLLLSLSLPQLLLRKMFKVTLRRQGHCTKISYTNTRVDSASKPRNYVKAWSNNSVLRRRLNDVSHGTALNERKRAFQAHEAATGNARSPSVVRRVDGTIRVGNGAGQR